MTAFVISTERQIGITELLSNNGKLSNCNTGPDKITAINIYKFFCYLCAANTHMNPGESLIPQRHENDSFAWVHWF